MLELLEEIAALSDKTTVVRAKDAHAGRGIGGGVTREWSSPVRGLLHRTSGDIIVPDVQA